MAKWQDKTIDKPKEPPKQKLPFVNMYNDYGFDHENFPRKPTAFRRGMNWENY